jgi:hypothetical protein
VNWLTPFVPPASLPGRLYPRRPCGPLVPPASLPGRDASRLHTSKETATRPGQFSAIELLKRVAAGVVYCVLLIIRQPCSCFGRREANNAPEYYTGVLCRFLPYRELSHWHVVQARRVGGRRDWRCRYSGILPSPPNSSRPAPTHSSSDWRTSRPCSPSSPAPSSTFSCSMPSAMAAITSLGRPRPNARACFC